MPAKLRLDELLVARGLSPTRAQAKALIMSGRVRHGTGRLDKPGKEYPSDIELGIDQPPRFVRALLYEYRFTSPAERRATGNWWKRELKGEYCPPLSWNPPEASNEANPGGVNIGLRSAAGCAVLWPERAGDVARASS